MLAFLSFAAFQLPTAQASATARANILRPVAIVEMLKVPELRTRERDCSAEANAPCRLVIADLP